MELSEMIKIMQHYENCGEVECSEDGFKTVLCTVNKEDDGELCWNWDEFDYRIKETKQKVTIEKWLCQNSQEEFIVIETSDIDGYGYLEKVKLIESYEVEL